MMIFYTKRSSKMGPLVKGLWSLREGSFLHILDIVLVMYYYVTKYPTIYQFKTTNIFYFTQFLMVKNLGVVRWMIPVYGLS